MTLVEIMIVVVIMGILAGLVLPYYTNTSIRAKTSALLTDLQRVRQSLERYRNDHQGSYPSTAQMWGNLLEPTDAEGNPAPDFGPYLKSEPVNQFTKGSEVAPDNGADWEYDENEGTIRGLAPAAVIEKLELSPLDVAPMAGSLGARDEDGDIEDDGTDDGKDAAKYRKKSEEYRAKYDATGNEDYLEKAEKYWDKYLKAKAKGK